MPLSKEQFSELRKKGLSIQQISKFEGGASPAPQKEEPKSEGIFSKLQKLGSAPGEFLKGQAKGVASTALSMGEIGSGLLEKGYDATIGKLTGTKAFKGAETAKAMKESEVMERKNVAQKIGFGTEQIGEFFIPAPGGAKTRVAGWMVEKAPGLMKMAEKAPRALKTAAKVAGGVAEDVVDVGARTYMQTADEDKARDAAMWTGLIGLPIKGGSELKAAYGKNLAGKVVNSLIKPNKRDFAYGKNPGKAISEEGIVASSFDDLAQKVQAKKTELGTQIDDVLSNEKYANSLQNVEDALKPIDEAITSAQNAPRTNSAKIKRLQDIKADLLGETTDDLGEAVFNREMKSLHVKDISQLKRDVGEMTAFTGNPSDDNLINAVLQDVYGLLKGKVEKVAPEIKVLNSKYGNFISASKAIKNRAEIVQRSNLVSLPQVNMGSGAAIATAIVSGGSVVPSLLMGASVAAVDKALATPAAKTAIAKWLASAKPRELIGLYKANPKVFDLIVNQDVKKEEEDATSPQSNL